MTNDSLHADVIVVGMGVMGTQVLLSLARRGVRAIGIEQFGLGHPHGASHGESKIIRTAYWEGVDYVPLAQRSWKLWQELEASTGTELIDGAGALMIGVADSPLVTGALAAAKLHDLPYELLDSAAVERRYPQHRITPDVVAFREQQAGLLRAETAVRAGAQAARDAGATIMERQRVTAIIPDPDRPGVRLGDRELCASHVVVTVGGWLPALLGDSRAPLHIARRVMGWFTVDDPALFGVTQFPVFVRGDAEDQNWYGFPTLDGSTVKIGLHYWPGMDEPVNPAEGTRPPDCDDAVILERVVAANLRNISPRPVRMQACTYALTPDHHFVVGAAGDDAPGVTMLAGFSGHGFKFAPVLGEAVADLALDGRTEHPIDLFDPRRFRTNS